MFFFCLGVNFYCKNCGRQGHRRHYCPELDQSDRRFRCRLCGEKGHNRRSCKKHDMAESASKTFKLPCCSFCGKPGHNRRTCLQRTRAAPTCTTETPVIKKGSFDTKKREASFDTKKRAYTCRVCHGEGHNIRTCPSRNTQLFHS